MVLTHGYSRCALHLLLMAAETKVKAPLFCQNSPPLCCKLLKAFVIVFRVCVYGGDAPVYVASLCVCVVFCFREADAGVWSMLLP